MRVIVNGVNLAPYIAAGGFTWKRNDVDSSDAGRTMDANMQRGRITSKVTLDVSCRLLTGSEARIVLNAIYPEYVTVQYDDPQSGNLISKVMYCSNCPAAFSMTRNGIEYWSGISFTLIER